MDSGQLDRGALTPTRAPAGGRGRSRRQARPEKTHDLRTIPTKQRPQPARRGRAPVSRRGGGDPPKFPRLQTPRRNACKTPQKPETRQENTMKTTTLSRRSESNWIGHDPATQPAARYWRKQAREVFNRFSDVELVEIVKTGRKLDSEILRRGARHCRSGCFVIIASTGGKWGKSRRDFTPVSGKLFRSHP